MNMAFSAPPPSSPLASRGVEDLSHQRPTCHNPSMRREQDRLESFQLWALSIITPAELAKAGFYYLGQNDRVACFSCGGQVCISGRFSDCFSVRWRPITETFSSAAEQLGAGGQSCVRAPKTLSQLPLCPRGPSRQRAIVHRGNSSVGSCIDRSPRPQQRVQPVHAAERRPAPHVC